MEDSEYPSYLKNETYDDLLGIRDEIDKKAYPARYAMVLAEIAERDKLPETAVTKVKLQSEKKRMTHILLGMSLALQGMRMLFSGHLGNLTVTEHPSGYWAVVGLNALGCGYFFCYAFKIARDNAKNNKMAHPITPATPASDPADWSHRQ